MGIQLKVKISKYKFNKLMESEILYLQNILKFPSRAKIRKKCKFIIEAEIFTTS